MGAAPRRPLCMRPWSDPLIPSTWTFKRARTGSRVSQEPGALPTNLRCIMNILSAGHIMIFGEGVPIYKKFQ